LLAGKEKGHHLVVMTFIIAIAYDK